MKRKQKRYTTEQEILNAIDGQKQRILDLKAEAVHQHWLIDNCDAECNRTNTGCYDHDHAYNEESAWRAIDRIEKQKLPKLKAALAAFRTELMPFTEDRGVVLQ